MDSPRTTNRGVFVANVRAGKEVLIGRSALVTVREITPDAVLLDVTPAGELTRQHVLTVGHPLELSEGPMGVEWIDGARAEITVAYDVGSHGSERHT